MQTGGNRRQEETCLEKSGILAVKVQEAVSHMRMYQGTITVRFQIPSPPSWLTFQSDCVVFENIVMFSFKWLGLGWDGATTIKHSEPLPHCWQLLPWICPFVYWVLPYNWVTYNLTIWCWLLGIISPHNTRMTTPLFNRQTLSSLATNLLREMRNNTKVLWESPRGSGERWKCMEMHYEAKVKTCQDTCWIELLTNTREFRVCAKSSVSTTWCRRIKVLK